MRKPVTVAFKSEPHARIQLRLHRFEVSIRGRQAHAFDGSYIQFCDVPASHPHVHVHVCRFMSNLSQKDLENKEREVTMSDTRQLTCCQGLD